MERAVAIDDQHPFGVMKTPSRAMSLFVGAIATVGAVAALVLYNGPGNSGKQVPTSAGQATAQTTAGGPTRWWSSPAGGVGSAIDVEQPERGAAALHPDSKAYCTMLRSSMSSPKNPLVRQSRGDNNLLLATRAWLAELEALSPSPVSTAWRDLAPSLLGALQPSASASRSGSSSSSAIAVIAADASRTCHLDLSKPPS